MLRTEQAEVADFDEARREHVLEEATDELLSRDQTVLELVRGRLFIGESDVAVLQLTEAVVAEGDAKDVRGELLEGCLAGADGLAVNYPALFPYAVHGGEEGGLFQLVTQLGAEDQSQRFFMHEEVRA
jgi:hypothetical protein